MTIQKPLIAIQSEFDNCFIIYQLVLFDIHYHLIEKLGHNKDGKKFPHGGDIDYKKPYYIYLFNYCYFLMLPCISDNSYF